MDPRVAAFVQYYAREGQAHHVQAVCNEVLRRAPSPALALWRAFGLLAGGATAEALRELGPLQHDPAVGPAATAAALQAHEAGLHQDRAAIAELRAQLEVEERSAAGEAALQLAYVLLHAGSFERARRVLERCLREEQQAAAGGAGGAAAAAAAGPQQQLPRLRALLGWVVLSQQLAEPSAERDAGEVAAAAALFASAAAQDPANLEALMGQARAHEAQGQLQAAADLAGELSIRWPWFVPGLIERARLLLAVGDWEGAAGAAGQLLRADAGNVTGLALMALHALVREGSARGAAARLGELAEAAAKEEPRSARIAYALARPFARLVAPDAGVLSVTLAMAQRAAALAPQNAEYIAEVGHQKLLLDDLSAARFHFEAAQHIDPLCAAAALGLAECAVAAGRLEEARQQLELLPGVLAAHARLDASGRHGGAAAASEHDFAPPVALAAITDRTADSSAAGGTAGDPASGAAGTGVEEPSALLYLRGLLAWASGERGGGLSLLERSVERQLSEVEDLGLPPGLELFSRLEAARALGVVRRLVAAHGADPRQPGEAPAPALVKGIRILEALGRYTGQLSEACRLYARALYLNGSFEAAGRKAAEALRAAPDDAGAHLLVVSIFVQQGRAPEAMAALDAAVAANFSVREAPLYSIVHAQASLRGAPIEGWGLGRPEGTRAAAAACARLVKQQLWAHRCTDWPIGGSPVLMANSRLEEARKVLETALAAPGVRAPLSAEQRERLSRRGLEPSLHERASVFLLLAEVLQRLWAQAHQLQPQPQPQQGQLQGPGRGAGGGGAAGVAAGRRPAGEEAECPEARKLLAEALREFAGTAEEARVALADCDLAVARGDADAALARLSAVPAASPHYARARAALAGVYLRARGDRAAYIRCYLDLVEPEKAVRAFDSALELSPKDAQLALKCAEALVAAHDYQRAVDYYNRAIRNEPSNVSYQHALASLLIRLGQLPAAQALLARCLERLRARGQGGHGGAEASALEAETLLLLAKSHAAAGDAAAFESHQTAAVGAQRALLSRLRGGASSGAGEAAAAAAARGKLVSMLEALAEHFAEEAHRDALSASPDHPPSLLALARLALARGDAGGCQAQCVALLRADPDDEAAGGMLAEIENLDSAIFHFAQLLERRPCHYEALAQMMGLLRRAGKLEEADKYLSAAEAAEGAARPGGGGRGGGGLPFCRGLQQCALGNAREALRLLNAARKDPAWAPRAAAQMVEVYLDPDGSAWGSESAAAADRSSSGGGGNGGTKADGRWGDGDTPADAAGAAETAGETAAETAASLLQQLRPGDVEPGRHAALTAYARMAGRRRADVEAAVVGLLEAAAGDPDCVPVLLALAHGFVLLKQPQKARAQLRRISKLPYRPSAADDFCRAWLALAEAEAAEGRADAARELCRRALGRDKSCGRAWELLGAIAEREGAHGDAAEAYEAAWRLTGRLVEAVGVAQAVLKADPAYPLIRRDVLERARAGLRP
ncbi:hypothetical protein Rsub_03470 [Raphidocelis subcapitata]|uniref:Uncharacterized protein n=1 Tax=Raphidocelis subcapitata TaxID=307507 RepID=A0A2V0NS72_9CHLO|nr:hypothetical protein Rsub_03470 [Raphidocelis subcapitata]|eukprot:GBF90474.1 hypothetical protein Rsub_03470 [Raphidocelis subcapitata]